MSFVKEAEPSLVFTAKGANEEIGQNIENTSATEKQNDQPKSKDVLLNVSMEEQLKHKEESRA